MQKTFLQRCGWILWIIATVTALFIWLSSSEDCWQYLFYLRVPILAGATLALLPQAALSIFRPMIGSLFVMRRSVKWQMPPIFAGATMAGLAVTLVARVIIENAPARFGVAKLTFDLLKHGTLIQYGTLILLGLPTVITVATLSTEGLLKQRETRKWWETALIFGTLWNISLLFITHILQKGLLKALPVEDLWQYELTLLLAAPICITVHTLTKLNIGSEDKVKGWKSHIRDETFVGIFLSFLVLSATYLAKWLATLLLGSSSSFNSVLVDIVNFSTKNQAQGYLIPSTPPKLILVHGAGLAFLAFGLTIYLILFVVFQPRPKPQRYEVPALLYLLLIIWNLTLFLGGMTFYLDFYRVPVAIVVLLLSAIGYWAWQVDHYFTLIPPPTTTSSHTTTNGSNTKPATEATLMALKTRLDLQQGDQKTLVVVCASGGGIQAAGWTVQVLKGLQEELGEGFTQAIGLISSVSGGSVGIMHYLDRFGPDGYPEDDEPEKAFKSATADGLDAIGWGMAYLDLWRVLGLPWMATALARKPFLRNKILDRGHALELDWRSEMKDPDKCKTLQDWQQQIKNGQIPIPIFNATLVEDGRRFLISPMTFGEDDDRHMIDFNTLYPNSGMEVVTAARLSANFPYVSPVCRNEGDNPKGNYHIADGGYFDNSGIVTAVEWLKDHHNQLKNELKIKNVLLVEISAFPRKPKPKQGSKAAMGWFMETVGPLQAMYAVRDTTQISRTRTAIELLKELWGSEVSSINIEHVPIFFPSSNELQTPPGVSGSSKDEPFYNQNKEYAPPLSWKLTEKEKKVIQDAWKVVRDDQIAPIQTIWGERGQ